MVREESEDALLGGSKPPSRNFGTMDVFDNTVETESFNSSKIAKVSSSGIDCMVRTIFS